MDDPTHQDLTAEQLIGLTPDNRTFLLAVDSTALATEEYPLLVVRRHEERGQMFRVVATELHSVENNLSIANMDFAEFADKVDEDGVFRGF
ncbi:hypothetical protein ABZW30_27105 [Kitasatospora sp. NPDC004669]|uniref:DUF6924 domain-containing protein n=1 Tax=Kitasatospora sp. NPDC004669 TaxID=3154555 RepID=UPI0033B99D62